MPKTVPPSRNPLLDRLDDFGKTIDDLGKKVLSPIFPEEKAKPKKPTAFRDDNRTKVDDSPSIYVPKPQTNTYSKSYSKSYSKAAAPRELNLLSQVRRRSSATAKSTPDDADFTPEKMMPEGTRLPERPSKPMAVPLYQRLSNFRQSPFDSEKQSAAAVAPSNAPSDVPSNVPSAVASKVPSNVPSDIPPDLASSRLIRQPLKNLDAGDVKEASPPKVAERFASPMRAVTPRPAAPIFDSTPDSVSRVESRPSPSDSGFATAAPATNVLSTRKGPNLSIETTGPRTIAIGAESTFQVNLTNAGDVAADDLLVHVSLPPWAEVAATKATLGDASMREADHSATTVEWRVGHLDAKSRERLTLKLIPRQNRPFDLAVRWECKPIDSKAMIEVQAPKLAMQLDGPREVSYGKKELYRLKLANTGDGDAENVVIVLTPIGTGENLPASLKVGRLPAGGEKSLEVELTARQAGVLMIRAEVTADRGIHANLAEKVLVHRAALTLDITGPKVQFVGAVASYVIRIRNSGTAPANNVRLTVALPAGAKYLSGIDGAAINAAKNAMEWTVKRFAARCRANIHDEVRTRCRRHEPSPAQRRR